MTAVYPARMLLFALACFGTDKTLVDTQTADTGEETEERGACPPWMGLGLGTDLTYSTTPEYEDSTSTTNTYTLTVVSHEEWDQGGTLVRTEGTAVYTASHISEYEGTSTATYGCNDEGAFLLTSASQSSYVSSGSPVETWYESVFDGYQVMSWTPEEGWYAEYDMTRSDENGSFDDPGDFEVVFVGEEEKTTPAGTFTALGLSFNDRVHHYSEGVGLVQSPSSWLVSQ
jgi:hypothetical protein